MHDLGTLGGIDSYGEDINDAGQVAGYSHKLIGGPVHAFLYSNGVIQDIDTLGSDVSYGYGINALGQVVGTFYNNVGVNTNSAAHAFLASGGTMYDLNGLVTNLASTDFSFLQAAEDINDNGWIVGYATTTSGDTHAFLAKPVPASVPEPATTGLLGLGTLLLAARRRRSA